MLSLLFCVFFGLGSGFDLVLFFWAMVRGVILFFGWFEFGHVLVFFHLVRTRF